YWHQYSNINTWYFWFILLSIIISLVILYFAIDKKRIFEISFYGYSVHVLWSKVDNALASHNYFVHPHSLTSFIPNGINMTSFVSVLYQSREKLLLMGNSPRDHFLIWFYFL